MEIMLKFHTSSHSGLMRSPTASFIQHHQPFSQVFITLHRKSAKCSAHFYIFYLCKSRSQEFAFLLVAIRAVIIFHFNFLRSVEVQALLLEYFYAEKSEHK
jgi:hypothetical protein